MVKSPAVEVLSPPKSRTATAGFPPPDLYIKAPRAVIVAEDHVVSEKSRRAVVPEVVGATTVSVLPPAVYPVPLTSLVVAYAVVAALSVADEVNNAILNACEVSELKSISPSRSAFLNDVHIACVIAIIYLL
jgi:hypothetical protein